LDKDSYPYPYYIDSQVPNFTWTAKSEQEIEETYEDPLNVKFSIGNEYNVKIQKRQVEFDMTKVHIFRVSLTPNEQRITQYKMQMKVAHFNEGMIDFKERFFVTFQQL